MNCLPCFLTSQKSPARFRRLKTHDFRLCVEELLLNKETLGFIITSTSDFNSVKQPYARTQIYPVNHFSGCSTLF